MKQQPRSSDTPPTSLPLLSIMTVLFSLPLALLVGQAPVFANDPNLRRLSLGSIGVLCFIACVHLISEFLSSRQTQIPQHQVPLNAQIPLAPIKDFEREIAHLIQETTGKQARLSSRIGLADIDVFDKTGRLMGIVHCVPFALAERFTPLDVRALQQARQTQAIKIAYAVTSGRFVRETQEEAKRLGIKLLDGVAVQRLRQQAKLSPLVLPLDAAPGDDARWSRPARTHAAANTGLPLFQADAPRHVLITGTPTVIVPRETVNPVSQQPYIPSVRPAGPAEWPSRASTRRSMPTVLIKMVGPASDAASVTQKLHAREFKSNRTVAYKRPSDG